MIVSKKKLAITILRDAFLCACFVFVTLSGIEHIPFHSDWLEPAGSAFKDFDWSDIYYSKIKAINEGKVKNEHIVLVNIGSANRAEITNTLIEVKKANADVTGLDIIFHDRGDSITDARLDSVITSFKENIVVSCFADSTYENRILSLEPMHIPFINNPENLGYINFIGEEIATVRSFYEREFYTDRMLNSFAYNTILKYKHKSDFNPFESVATTKERLIPYQSYSDHYTTLNWKELVGHTIDPKILEGKIVLLGFCGTDDGYKVINDEHFTPLNENYAGKALPDMYGIIIHANIIEAYLDNYKIVTPARWVQILACISYTTILLFVYLLAFKLKHYWRKLIELILLLFSAFAGLLLAVYFLSVYSIKCNLGELIASIALIEPIVAIYEAVIHYVCKIYPIKNIFSHEE